MTMTADRNEQTSAPQDGGPDWRRLPPPKRPAEYLLRKWKGVTAEMRSETIRSYLVGGYALCLCCLDCPRCIQWTPPELAERFAGKLNTTIADLVGRVACKG
jgi:hypothetical protein